MQLAEPKSNSDGSNQENDENNGDTGVLDDSFTLMLIIVITNFINFNCNYVLCVLMSL